jgi:hypothetical protein
MTAYRYGPTRAHVMQHRNPDGWQSLCNYRLTYDPSEHADGYDPDWPILHFTEDHAPHRPWCTRCLSRVAELARAVGLIE